MFGFLAFALQELPYIPWLLWPPQSNPLAGNDPANMFLGILEQAGGFLTIALLILVVFKAQSRPSFKQKPFYAAALCLLIYYVCWIFYFAGVTNPWMIVLGMSSVVPLYYLFVAIWVRNPFAVFTSILFFLGHTGSNMRNFL